MSISVELPSAMEREVMEYVQGQGKTLDQLLRGAALNAVEIAEHLIKRNLV